MKNNSKSEIMDNKNYDALNQHVQLGGQAYYDERKYFMFTPAEPAPGMVTRMRRMTGVAQQMTDGTFDFVPHPRIRANSKLIKKLAHGRASETRDGAIQLTLKVFKTEGVNINETILSEAVEAAKAIREYQLKR